jgi:rhamnosyltransferase
MTAAMVPRDGRSPVAPMLDVAAVIVTYEPDLAALGAMLSSLAAEPCAAIVVDNSESAGASDRVRGLCDAQGAIFRAALGNVGIAAAQNLALAHLWRTGGCRNVLFLDQDSTIPRGFVRCLLLARTPVEVSWLFLAQAG